MSLSFYMDNKKSSKADKPHYLKNPASDKPFATKSNKPFLSGLSVNIVLTLVFIVFGYWILAVKNGFMLRWYEEMSLFEPNQFFLRQFIYYPGGILRYAGAYLTQFMYHPFLGTTLLIILWLILIWLTKKIFRLNGKLYSLSFMVPLALLVSVVQLDEAWLTLKSAGYLFFNTLGYIFTLLLYYLYKQTGKNILLSTLSGVLIAVCYFIGGFYALLATLLCVACSVARGVKSGGYKCYISAFIIMATGLVVPLLYYPYFHGNTVDNDYPYLKGLPELLMESYDLYLWMPFIVATLWILILFFLSVSGSLKDKKIFGWLGLVSVCGGMIWGMVAERKSEQFRATVLMLQHLDKNDWRGISRIMSLIKEPPNYSMRVLNNLARVNMGGVSEDLSSYGPVNFDPRHSETFSVTAFIQVPVNYHIGRFNQSYRWAMEHTVQYGKRVFFLKYMVKDCLLNGDIQLAKKYNDILHATMFHKKWAENMDRYIDDPSLINKDKEFTDIMTIAVEEYKRGE